MLSTIASVGVPALVALGTTWLVQRGNRQTKKLEAEASPYSALADRVVKLEEKVQTLEAFLRNDRHWIVRTITRVITYDAQLTHLLVPWPDWYEHDGYPPQPDQSAPSPQDDRKASRRTGDNRTRNP